MAKYSGSDSKQRIPELLSSILVQTAPRPGGPLEELKPIVGVGLVDAGDDSVRHGKEPVVRTWGGCLKVPPSLCIWNAHFCQRGGLRRAEVQGRTTHASIGSIDCSMYRTEQIGVSPLIVCYMAVPLFPIGACHHRTKSTYAGPVDEAKGTKPFLAFSRG